MTSFGAGLRRFMRCAMGAAVLLAGPLEAVADTSLRPARDLATDAESANHSGTPLIVLVSLAGCPHCEVVRRSHLLPLLAAGAELPTPVVRQVEINGRELLRDFSGKQITHGEFARRYTAKLAPAVIFFDARGKLLAKPLIGAMIPDFYGAYFDAAYNEAKSKLRATRPQNRRAS